MHKWIKGWMKGRKERREGGRGGGSLYSFSLLSAPLTHQLSVLNVHKKYLGTSENYTDAYVLTPDILIQVVWRTEGGSKYW